MKRLLENSSSGSDDDDVPEAFRAKRKQETSSEEEKSKSPLSSPIHTLTPAASTEMRRMSFYKMDSAPATIEELPRPLAQSSVALASFPRRIEPFPPPLAQSSFVDIPTGLKFNSQLLFTVYRLL